MQAPADPLPLTEGDREILTRLAARHQEFLKFLAKVDRETPKGLDIHMILDNYSTHKHAAVKAWLEMHPRFHLHFTPTSSSRLNLVERWFRELTDKALRRGVFHSVPDLISKIQAYLDAHNKVNALFAVEAMAELKLRMGAPRAAQGGRRAGGLRHSLGRRRVTIIRDAITSTLV